MKGAPVPPVVCFVGPSGAGKTTFLERLIAELNRRGYRVGTIKHHRGDFEVDRPGKDTWRHARAGARAVCISSPRKVAVIRQVEEDPDPLAIASLLGPVDIVLVEGYKEADLPQVEVCRPGSGPQVGRKDRLVAVVGGEAASLPVPHFDPAEVSAVADFLQRKFLTGRDGCGCGGS